MIRLKSTVACPSDPNANAVCVALKTYGETVDDNGCCWNLYTEKEVRSLDGRGADLSIPSAVSNWVGTLVITDYDVIDPVWSGVY
jgi:hypothetical protein